MRIYLLRHGRAEDGFGMRDEDRALTEDGRARLREAAPAWRRLVEPLDVVVTSPLRRARETASILVEAVSSDPGLRTEDAIVPGGNPAMALAILEDELANGTAGIAFVGHEPHLGSLLGLLLTGSPQHALPLKKGMLIALDLQSPTSLLAELHFALTQKAAARM